MNNLGPQDVILSKRQHTVFNWLNCDLALPVFADAYKGALKFLHIRPPGYITFVSHVGRDLMNELVVTVKKMQSLEDDANLASSAKQSEGGHADYRKFVNKLQEVWKDAWGSVSMDGDKFQSDFGAMPNESACLEAAHLIPLETCKKIQDLIDAHRAGHERALNKGALFFTTFLDYAQKEAVPKNLFKEWESARKWFAKYNHLRKGRFDKDESSKVNRHFRMLENLLFVAACGTFERLSEINEVLEETNQ